MANRWRLATWLLALALGLAPRAAAAQSRMLAPSPNRAADNPLRDPAPAATLEASEFSLPPPIEDSPALQYASAVEEQMTPPEEEILPKPSGPRWQGDSPAWVKSGVAPLSESELAPDGLPPGMLSLAPDGEPLDAAIREAYPPAFKTPMMRESWMFRPFHYDGFIGTLLAADPVRRRVEAGSGFYIGFRLGWDMSKHFGMESNFGFSKVGNSYPALPTKMGDEKLFLWDVDWLWYPWGDTRLRPYLLIGGGLNDVNFVNDLDQRIHSTLFNMPWGGGLKYRFGNRVAFRFDVRDNVTYGAANGMNLMHNVAITANVEMHFGGGPRRGYWPWNPSRSWW